MPDVAGRLARHRVPLGFAFGVVCLWLAQPSWWSLALGLPVAALGEAIRVWAAGHLEKGREVTRSGPYRFTGHPLYLGSLFMGTGLAVAARSVPVAIVVFGYLAGTLVAAMRTEERWLRQQFGEEYRAYRAGAGTSGTRTFSVTRFWQNREHRALIGLLAAILLLALRVR